MFLFSRDLTLNLLTKESFVAKDTNDRKTRDLIPLRYTGRYQYVDPATKKLRTGTAVTEAESEEAARTAIASDLNARYGPHNWRLHKVQLW